MKNFLLLCTLLFSASAFGECFEFDGKGPVAIGPVSFEGYPAKKVCVLKIGRMGGGHYYSLKFSDEQGDIAQLASQTEVHRDCPGFCRTYELTSGNALGKNVDPDGTVLSFQVESIGYPGTLTDKYKKTKKTYQLKN